ncbi:ABC-type taurine transport system substrate-binding protein [Pseudomonas psychrotolerans]|nr:ABC-type taurine transport system substrate-binding protein [Pseudomonas psychrotolerans]
MPSLMEYKEVLMALLSFRRLARLFVVLAVALGVWAPVQAAEQQLRIGYQKGGGLLAVLKAQGTLEKALGAQGYQVTWREFQAGPQLLEGPQRR